ncbi:hypothetical protein ACFWPQ_33150 [Streptomyces sp. NPDC058464]|uniref:hypothetical protein n=1 Tax=Streptomyces sp. NPDC058464 TaxID=3346511 RepID=UPI003657ED77
MPLTHVVITSGRSIELTHLRLFSTYGGLLEGYPHQALNDRLVKGLLSTAAAADPRTPAHLVPPPREHPDDGRDGRDGHFGPVEILPPVACTGLFESTPVNPDNDPVLHRSALTIVWFQATPQPPSVQEADRGLREVAWEELAQDYEL